MNSERVKELQDFSNEFYLKLNETEDMKNINELDNNTSDSQKIKKSFSTLNSDPQLKTSFINNIQPKRRFNPKKNKSSLKLSAYNTLLPWIPPQYIGKYFENFKRLKDEHEISSWEKYRVHLCQRSYQKEKLLPLKKDFVCKKLWNYELNKFPNTKFTIDDSVKNLSPSGKNLIKLFMSDYNKKEQKQKMKEEQLYAFKHSKPPVDLNPWKFSNHVIEEFSRPKVDEIYGYKEKKKTKYAYTVDPFRRPKEQGDLFDRHIGIL